MSMSIAQQFNRRFNGKANVVTPHVIEYGSLKNNYIYELSSGSFMDVLVFGVTVINSEETGDRTDAEYNLSRPFNTLAEAKEYISNLELFYENLV